MYFPIFKASLNCTFLHLHATYLLVFFVLVLFILLPTSQNTVQYIRLFQKSIAFVLMQISQFQPAYIFVLSLIILQVFGFPCLRFQQKGPKDSWKNFLFYPFCFFLHLPRKKEFRIEEIITNPFSMLIKSTSSFQLRAFPIFVVVLIFCCCCSSNLVKYRLKQVAKQQIGVILGFELQQRNYSVGILTRNKFALLNFS